MFKINRKVEYALIVLKHMSETSALELTSAREIGEKYRAPFDTVAKVMQILCSHQILKSSKGIHGGYRLIQDLSSISYLTLVEMIDGTIPENICESFTNKNACSQIDHCNIIKPIEKLNLHVKKFLATLNLNQILKAEIKKTSTSIDGDRHVC